MGEVDEAFIQAVEHRPKLTITEAEGIPLINLSISIETLVEEIGDACKNWGFFQVINHGVPFETREKLELASRKFFAQATEEKLKVRRDEVNPLGYYETELTKNVRDWKEVYDLAVKNPTVIPTSPDAGDNGLQELVNQWPEYPSELRNAKEMEKLAYKLLELISLSLGLPANRLSGFFNNHTSISRLNYYPTCPIPNLALGVGRHKDGGALIILAQDDVGGLQVKRKTDGEWVQVRPTPHAYIVNVGDIIQGNEDLILVHEMQLNLETAVYPWQQVIIPKYGIFENNNSLWELAQMPQWTPEKPLRVATGFTYMGIADAIVDLVSRGTTLRENNFKEIEEVLLLNHYPSCPIPNLALGVGRHKDPGALTILAQDDVGGLQVKRKTDGEWVQVKPTPHAYIVNLGDIIQVPIS
ncbi:hypothetical protein C3L33_20888, partial [Rhododendron williamsianum]